MYANWINHWFIIWSWLFLNKLTKIVLRYRALWLIHSLSSRRRLYLTADLYSGSARLEPRSRRRLSWLGFCFVFLISYKWMNFMDLRKYSDCCPTRHLLIGFYNRDGVCLLRGTNWIIIIQVLFLLWADCTHCLRDPSDSLSAINRSFDDVEPAKLEGRH